MAGPLISTLKRAVTLVVAYWPALLTWYLIGIGGQFVTIQIAGWVGASSPAGGLALMPIAILFRLLAFVAMLLVVREALPALRALSPVPLEANQRRREFTGALLAGVVPFFTFYFAWGYLGDDMRSYYLRLYEVQTSRAVQTALSGGEVADNAYGMLKLTWFTGAAIVITFVLRRLVKRFTARLPRLIPLVTVYLEAVWVFLSALVIGRVVSDVRTWAASRQGVAWFTEIRQSIASVFAPLDWVMQVVGWLIGELGGVILLPLAWITIAGVIYGQAIVTRPVVGKVVASRLTSSKLVADKVLADRRVKRARHRIGSAPKWLLERLRDLWDDLVDRFRPIGRALSLMLHVGPVLVAGYVLLFRLVDWLRGEVAVGFPHLLGAHSYDFWLLWGSSIALLAPVLTAPLTIGVVAATFDTVLARLEATTVQTDSTASPIPSSRQAPPADPATATVAP